MPAIWQSGAANMHDEQAPDDMKSEYPSCIEQTFHHSLEVTCFNREMTKALDVKRIGWPVPYDPSRRVHTFWDIGMDEENCIWFYQGDGVRHRPPARDFPQAPPRAVPVG